MEEPQVEEPEDRLGMTDEQWEWFTRGYGDQDENGDDIPIKLALGRLTPTERAERERRTEPLYEELRRASARARSRTVR